MEPNYRRCISCRVVAPKTQFLRVVRQPTGTITLNSGVGRSAYICPNPDCVSLAQKKKRLERALKTTVPSSVYTALGCCLTNPS